MALLHDPRTSTAIKQRLATLRRDSTRRWGKMSVDQMLHHVNLALEAALGRLTVEQVKFPMPSFLLKFLVIHVPWPKGAPTAPEFVVGERYDFEAERTRCLALVDELIARPLGGPWPKHFSFKNASGTDFSRLHAKHLDHHLKQFSA